MHFPLTWKTVRPQNWQRCVLTLVRMRRCASCSDRLMWHPNGCGRNARSRKCFRAGILPGIRVEHVVWQRAKRSAYVFVAGFSGQTSLSKIL